MAGNGIKSRHMSFWASSLCHLYMGLAPYCPIRCDHCQFYPRAQRDHSRSLETLAPGPTLLCNNGLVAWPL